MSQASPCQENGQNARSCKMGTKHWLYHQPIFWIQVTILLATAELVSSCRSAAPPTTVVRNISTQKLEPRKKNTQSVVIRTARSRETSPAAKGVEFPTKGVELPTFFPPRATDRFPIPVGIADENVTLQQLADRLSQALKDAGYEGKCSYYWLDDLHGPGFAIVTHIEHIQPDGKPVLDQRWGFDLPRYGPLTLGSLLGALMHADPGRYRLLALVVCKEPLVEKETPMTTHQVQELSAGPKWLADSPLKTVVPTEDFHLIAYVYEFERKSRSDDPALMVSSNLTAEQHLRSTALYDDIEEYLSK